MDFERYKETKRSENLNVMDKYCDLDALSKATNKDLLLVRHIDVLGINLCQ